LPSHIGGIAALLPLPRHQARERGTELGRVVPINSFVSTATVSGRSVLSRSLRQRTPTTVVSSAIPPESVIAPFARYTR